MRAESYYYFFLSMREGGKKSIFCSKTEETRGAPFKCFPLFLRSPCVVLASAEVMP